MPRITKTIAISTNRLRQRQPDRSKNASPCKLKEGAKCKDCWAIIMAATARMSFLGLGIPRYAFFQLLAPPLNFRAGEILVAVIHRLELAAIDRNAWFR